MLLRLKAIGLPARLWRVSRRDIITLLQEIHHKNSFRRRDSGLSINLFWSFACAGLPRLAAAITIPRLPREMRTVLACFRLRACPNPSRQTIRHKNTRS
jgi:hypothetical protein